MEMVKEATKMFAEGAGGVVLGSACDSFLKSIGKCCMFDYPVLESVKSTVENLRAVIPEMEDFNNKLGDRGDEVKELKEKMERGTRLLDEMSDPEVRCRSLFKASYNDQLVGLDASLKSLVGKLHLQSAIDVKEVLVSTKETGRVVKRTKRKVDEVDEKVEEIQKSQEMMLNMMKKQEQKDLANQGGLAFEGAGLVAGLEEIAGLTLSWFRFRSAYEEMNRRARLALGLVETKTAASEETLYFRVGELRDFRMLIEEGVDDLRKCATILEWTDDLKSQYTSKFRDLNKTLEALYNRLAGMRPFRWRCGNCDESLAKASTSIGGSAGFAIQGN